MFYTNAFLNQYCEISSAIFADIQAHPEKVEQPQYCTTHEILFMYIIVYTTSCVSVYRTKTIKALTFKI